MELLVLLAVIGAIVIFNHDGDQSSPAQKSSFDSIVQKIRNLSQSGNYTDQEKTIYAELAQSMEDNRLPRSVETLSQEEKQALLASGKVAVSQTESQPRAEVVERSALQKDAEEQLRQLLKNVNTLLFGGATLIVASAAILVGSNLETITDPIKVGIVALFALGFYLSGLTLYEKPKYRPAAATFIGIGLILIPLTGLAVETLLTPESWRWPALFVTSAVSFMAFMGTYRRAAYEYIQYLALSAAVLMVEFALLSVGAEFTFLVWGLLVSGIVMLLLARPQISPNFQESLVITAYGLVPVAYLANLTWVFADGTLWQLGVSTLLASLFYGLSGQLSENSNDQEVLGFISAILLPFGLALIAAEIQAGFNNQLLVVGGVFGAGSLLFSLADNLTLPSVNAIFPGRSLRFAAILQVPISGVLLIAWPKWLTIALGIWVVQFLAYFYRQRSSELLLVSAVALLLLPWVGLNIAFEVPKPLWLTTASYFSLGWIFLGLEMQSSRQLAEETKLLLWSAAIVCFSGVLLFSNLDGNSALASLGFLATAHAALVASFRYDLGWLVLAAAGLELAGIITAFELVESLPSDTYLFFGGAMLGVLNYTATLVEKNQYKSYFQLSSFGLLGLAMVTPEINLSIIANVAVGALIALDISSAREKHQREIGIAVLLIAFERILFELGFRELQMYTVPWALYAGGLALREHLKNPVEQNQDRDLWVVIALAVLTGPLLLQVYTTGSFNHFVAIIIESIILMVAGTALNYRLFSIWGLATLGLSTFERLVAAIRNIPNYVVTLVAGLTLLGIALKFLQKNKD